MTGESYYAYPQWLAAAQNPPHLSCIAPYDGLIDSYRDTAFHGGIFGCGFVAWWTTNTRALTLLERDPGEHPNDGGSDVAGDFMRHPLYDEYWKTRSAHEKFGQITTPFYSMGNWTAVGIHLRGNLLAFEAIDAPKKLLVAGGDTHHASIEMYYQDEVHSELTRWHGQWLKGIDTGIMDEPPVKYWMGNDGWRTAQTWPFPEARYVPTYLSGAKAGACESLNDGSLTWTEPTEQEPTRFDYPQRSWGGWPGFGTAAPTSRGMDNTVAINTFTSSPLDEDMELAGPVVLRLWLSSTAADADVIAKSYEVPAAPRPDHSSR